MSKVLQRLRRKYLFYRNLSMELEIVWSEAVFDQLCKQKLPPNPSPEDWANAAREVFVDLAKKTYRNIQERSLAPHQFRSEVEKVLHQKNLDPKKGSNWLRIAREVSFTCDSCLGSGTYPARPVPGGFIGKCYRCGGNGRQNDADRIRNITYDRYHKELRDQHRLLNLETSIEEQMHQHHPNSKEYRRFADELKRVREDIQKFRDRMDSDAVSQKFDDRQNSAQEYARIRKAWIEKQRRRKGSQRRFRR